jgi:transcriptional regulator with XRE-family HTH domain
MITLGNNFLVTMGNVGRGRPATEVPSGNNFGAWLRSTRLKRGLTGEALAFAFGKGMTQGRISAYERGIKKPERQTASELATALGADPREALEALIADTPGFAPAPELEPQTELERRAVSAFSILSDEEQESVLLIIERIAGITQKD